MYMIVCVVYNGIILLNYCFVVVFWCGKKTHLSNDEKISMDGQEGQRELDTVAVQAAAEEEAAGSFGGWFFVRERPKKWMIYIMIFNGWLVVWLPSILFSHILGISSFQLTNN